MPPLDSRAGLEKGPTAWLRCLTQPLLGLVLVQVYIRNLLGRKLGSAGDYSPSSASVAPGSVPPPQPRGRCLLKFTLCGMLRPSARLPSGYQSSRVLSHACHDHLCPMFTKCEEEVAGVSSPGLLAATTFVKLFPWSFWGSGPQAHLNSCCVLTFSPFQWITATP